MMPIRFAIFDIQIVNTLDNCYFLYGTPMVGDSEYDDVAGAFTSDAIVWNEVCTLPWTMNEMEVNTFKPCVTFSVVDPRFPRRRGGRALTPNVGAQAYCYCIIFLKA